MAALSALALTGCVHRSGPVATAPAGGDLDSVAYGQLVPTAPPRYAMRPPRYTSSVPVTSVAYSRPRVAYAAPVRGYDADYRLDAGDKLRVVVYGQEGLTNTYAVSASGSITMPLIGTVPARGLTPSQLARSIADRLRNGYIREPSVAAEVESYRPFFILGEVAAPGQYPYVPNMTAESAVAIAGGFSPRARRDHVTITHTTAAGTMRVVVSPATPIKPGDTIVVDERWF
jgi:polysaccharide export outer membrane protein